MLFCGRHGGSHIIHIYDSKDLADVRVAKDTVAAIFTLSIVLGAKFLEDACGSKDASEGLGMKRGTAIYIT
jgi:bifunctional ADP-heptose synthase (sugar kinase/adenylyltransferase)